MTRTAAEGREAEAAGLKLIYRKGGKVFDSMLTEYKQATRESTQGVAV